MVAEAVTLTTGIADIVVGSAPSNRAAALRAHGRCQVVQENGHCHGVTLVGEAECQHPAAKHSNVKCLGTTQTGSTDVAQKLRFIFYFYVFFDSFVKQKSCKCMQVLKGKM